VKRVCDDPSVIQSFDSIGVEYTPTKVVVTPFICDFVLFIVTLLLFILFGDYFSLFSLC
jgi:hypothetical protein